LALKLWVVLVSVLLGAVSGVVVYILAVFGSHYPQMFWASIAIGAVVGLLVAWNVLASR
jgi:hypothetical protein